MAPTQPRDLRLTICDTYRILLLMIVGFANSASEDFFKEGVCPARWRAVASVLSRKLDMLDAAPALEHCARRPEIGSKP